MTKIELKSEFNRGFDLLLTALESQFKAMGEG